MDISSNPIARRVNGITQGFKRPGNASSQRTPAAPSSSLAYSNLKPDNLAPTQAGCGTLKPGGYRKKVSLKPGHSALDWHDLVTNKGRKSGLVAGSDRLLRENTELLQNINSPHSLSQLDKGVPLYLIRPPLRIDRELLEKHATLDDCWCVIKGNVYCLTYYFDFHPGGVDILFDHCAGKDGTVMFNKYHRWVSFEKLLETCLVGVYVD